VPEFQKQRTYVIRNIFLSLFLFVFCHVDRSASKRSVTPIWYCWWSTRCAHVVVNNWASNRSKHWQKPEHVRRGGNAYTDEDHQNA